MTKKKIIYISILAGIIYSIIFGYMIKYDLRISLGDTKLKYDWNMIFFVPINFLLIYIFSSIKKTDYILKVFVVSLILSYVALQLAGSIAYLFFY